MMPSVSCHICHFELDVMHRTAGAVGQDEPRFQIGHIEYLPCTVTGEALNLRKVAAQDWVRTAGHGLE
jgi:hypothetical protein